MQDDGSVVLTWTVPAASTPGAGVPSSGATSDPLGSTPGTTAPVPRRLAAVLAAPPGLRFEARSDRSVAVLGSGPDVVGALPRVVVVDDTGAPLVADLVVRATDPGLLDVLVDPGPAGSAALTFGATPLVSADWGEREGGRSLAVVPASWVRAGSVAALDALWSALVVVAPDADSTSMHDQLTCHALGAPTKDSWNLEPWRPEVDVLTLLAARCNP
ncbi:DUF2599 domain-containing protein [Pengzhenrongella frigida]|uniref:DUF2599 domain-containing protein n=2 Tax=Pengzhenrongella frigida TaxID=1259133 RepID=A0A4Q5MV76_9MICO|nr:DUF2599 domain-containing protein [Cellulomonas sp. HLT2-17]